MKYCKKCLMPDTRPGLTFDNDGTCAACVNFEKQKDTSAQNVNIKFAHRGMIYACNIYPFKMPYNVSKSVLRDNSHISFFKSIRDDDG